MKNRCRQRNIRIRRTSYDNDAGAIRLMVQQLAGMVETIDSITKGFSEAASKFKTE